MRWEDSAEQATVTGWRCKNCTRFYGKDERAARFCCCTDRPCEECDGRTGSGSYILCQDCRRRREDQRWQEMERRDWNGTDALCEWDGDEFFFDADDVVNYCEEHGIQPWQLRLMICVRRPIEWDCLADHFEDELLTNDGSMDWNTSEIDKVISEWVKEHAPKMWEPSKYAATPESIMRMVGSAL